MNNAIDLVRSYNEGRLTLDGLFLSLLSLSRKQDLIAMLESLPPDLLARLHVFVETQTPQARVFNGPRPKMENVRLVEEWLQGVVEAEKKT